MGDEIYLDWNATTPLHPEVAAAMRDAAETGFGNPSSVHAVGRRARALVESAREALARVLEVHPRDVLFTASATEANNLALAAAPAMVTSRLEHPSVVRVAEHLSDLGRPVRWLPVGPSGRVDARDVAEALAGLPDGAVVAVMAANHETGVVQPTAEVAEVTRAAGARLHVDAVQALGKLEPSAFAMADSVVVSAHKLQGPKGVGALAFRGPPPRPLLVGGAQQRGLRPGTLDAVAIAGFARAVELASPERARAIARLRDAFETALTDLALVNGAGSERLPHVSNLSFAGFRGDELAAALDLCQVCVASGSACSAGTTEPSAVVSAMLGGERAASAVRVSLGSSTTEGEIQRAILLFRQVVARRPGDAQVMDNP
jgi:cysteine desulfurase